MASRLHPESSTLGDFRAPAWLAEAESAALEPAQRLITPHSAAADLYPTKSEKLDWQMPGDGGDHRGGDEKAAEPARRPAPVVVFPASTVGRRGQRSTTHIWPSVPLEPPGLSLAELSATVAAYTLSNPD